MSDSRTATPALSPSQSPNNIPSEVVMEAENKVAEDQKATQEPANASAPKPAINPSLTTSTFDPFSNIETLNIKQPVKTGNLQNSDLNEVSGMSASLNVPGVLYAINDSGNTPRLYALNEQGQLLATWNIAVRNRDWEDMARISYAGNNYLIIGDTGDNLRSNRCAVMHFLLEPAMSASPAQQTELTPSHSIKICFEDGPRNIEAFAIVDNTLYMLSKEPVTAAGRTPSGVYRVHLPEGVPIGNDNEEFLAVRVAEMQLRGAGLEVSLAAALAGVDLSHPTSMEFDQAGSHVFILTYREVLRITKGRDQSWADAFSKPAERVLSHKLRQAEALTVSPGRAVWFTSENVKAPLWAIPLASPL